MSFLLPTYLTTLKMLQLPPPKPNTRVSMAAALVLLLPLVVNILLIHHQAALGGATNICPPCGKLEVPYPLSTGSSCGHPLYTLTCTPQGLLQIRGLSGSYPVQSIDARTHTMVIGTGEFLGSSCMTRESISSGNFSLDPSGPFSISPNNTILYFNASSFWLISPVLSCKSQACSRVLAVFPQKSCRNLVCCSFPTAGNPRYRYSFRVTIKNTGYASLVNWVSGSQPSSWLHFGLQLQWDEPHEPPCSSDTQCGANSACLPSPATNLTKVCLCNKGYLWQSSTGTCLKAPYCVRKRNSIECHKSEYAAGLTLGFVGLIVFTSLIVIAYMKRRSAHMAHAKLVLERSMILATNNGGMSARLFSYREMERATNNFAQDRILGCGGFGEVYKGILDDGSMVAIKLAKIGNIKGIEQVLNEVRILSQVNHKNLVRLLGCCVDMELPLIVYEYMPNGSLYDHLHGLEKGFLDWRTRLLIGLQCAEGLAYLHSAAYPPIYHRDVKSSNILLDQSMNARVADFGLSRLVEPDLTHVSTCVQGTLGYLDPEYHRNYQLTDKSDVYSFGVVLLELVTSERAIDFGRHPDDLSLVVMVQSMKEENCLDNMLDLELVDGASTYAIESMRDVINLALHCLQENRLDRPSMKKVAEKLQSIIYTIEVANRSFERETLMLMV